MKIGIYSNAPVFFTLGLAQILSKYDSVEIKDSHNHFDFLFDNNDSDAEIWYDVAINDKAAKAAYSLIINPTEPCDKYMAVFSPLVRDLDYFKSLTLTKPEDVDMLFVTEFIASGTKLSEKTIHNEFNIKKGSYYAIPLNEHDVAIEQSFLKELNANNLSTEYQIALLAAFNYITDQEITKIRKITRRA